MNTTEAAISSFISEIDFSWWDRALCRGWLGRNPNQGTPWTMASNDAPLDGIPAHRIVDYALLVCSACPAQYSCATHAVENEERAGTWAMRVKTLLWLQKRPDWRDILLHAELEAMPVQVAVRARRRAA